MRTLAVMDYVCGAAQNGIRNFTSCTNTAKASKTDTKGSKDSKDSKKDSKKATDSKSEEISIGCIVEVR